MSRRNLIVGFLWRFVLVYGLLIFPWPGFNQAYGGYFRTLGQMTFAQEAGRRFVRFEAVPENLHHRLDTRIALVNRDRLNREGKGPVRYLELDSRGVGWVPTALLLALILATPVSPRRRGVAVLMGMISVHVFILFSVASTIWNNSTDLALLTLAPFWKTIVAGLDETLITQMGASFVAPVIIWIVVTFRRQDAVGWRVYPENFL